MTIWVTFWALRVRQNVLGDLLAARQGERLAAEPLGEAQGVGDAGRARPRTAGRCAASRP